MTSSTGSAQHMFSVHPCEIIEHPAIDFKGNIAGADIKKVVEFQQIFALLPETFSVPCMELKAQTLSTDLHQQKGLTHI